MIRNIETSTTSVDTHNHYSDVIMTTMASQITSLTIVYSAVYSDSDQRKHQSSASLAFVWGFHRDRWIPRTKGQLRGKCFHLMTSSWYCHWGLSALFQGICWTYQCHVWLQYWAMALVLHGRIHFVIELLNRVMHHMILSIMWIVEHFGL